MPTRNVHISSSLDKAQTAAQVFRALSIPTWEERDSDNYPDGSYYLGEGGEVEVKVSADDHAAFEEFPYRVAVHTSTDSPFSIDEVLDLMIAELLKGGFRVARELDYKDGVVERETYSLDRSANLVRRRDSVKIPDD
jgi:hypothetical protein